MRHGNNEKLTPARGIRADEVLPLAVFCQRLNLGAKGWRTLRDAGLRSARIGKQRFICGADAVQFFRTLAERGDGDGAERIVEAVHD